MTHRAADYYHPVAGFSWFACMLALCMLFMHPLFIILGLIFACALNLLYGGVRALAAQLRLGLPLLIFVTLFNPLVNHRGSTALFYLYGSVITRESLFYGLCSGAMLLLIFLWFGVYNRLIPPDKFFYLFSRFAPTVSLLIVMTQRMIPLFNRRLRRITAAQKTLQSGPTQGSARKRLRNALSITSVLMGWSMEEGLDTADSMKARGYGVAPRRTMYASYRFRPADAAAMIVTLLLTAGCSAAYYLSPGFEFFPTAAFRLSPALALSAACFTLLGLLPILIECREVLQCRCSK